ncbi:MAG: PHP domain-containing protein [Clostridia bacterium]|jgi:putative hydrolase|nr:PHP domain-containing protein [Clostridia bacterium]
MTERTKTANTQTTEFYGDYHTHTVYSHGKGSIEDSVLKAARLGLKEIAVTDHGFRHMVYNVRRGEIARMRAEIDGLAVKYPQVKVLLGVEANILSRRGDIDVLPSDKQTLDIVVCGYHKLVWHSPAAAAYFWANNTGRNSAATVARNTDAYLGAIEKNDIDILSHPGNGCPCEIREVARACKFFGTLFELNGKRIALNDRALEEAANEGCTFICSSDAHNPMDIGNFALPLARLQKLGVPLEQIANYGKRPAFRSERGRED